MCSLVGFVEGEQIYFFVVYQSENSLFVFNVLHRKNIILTDVSEERNIRRSDYGAATQDDDDDLVRVQRELAQAMIPGKHLVKVEIEKATYEKRI